MITLLNTRLLLDAGANAQWQSRMNNGWSAMFEACNEGHLSTVEMLLNHDNGLLEIADDFGATPLTIAISTQRLDIFRFLLNRGANVHATNVNGTTKLVQACHIWDLKSLRLLLAAGVEVEARDGRQRTALHLGAELGRIRVLRELILHHNANMFAVDKDGKTPFDRARHGVVASIIKVYGTKIAQEEGRLALHTILRAVEYSFVEARADKCRFSYVEKFHPPLNPLQVCLPLGKLTLQHFRTLLDYLDTESIRNRDCDGKLPMHVACGTSAPFEILTMLVELDSATLQIADYTGALPIHLLCGSDYASVRYLVEQGGVGTLAARNLDGALPLHAFCGSTQPGWRIVQYMIQPFPGAVKARTNAGGYAFMLAACESSLASLSVVYELARTNSSAILRK